MSSVLSLRASLSLPVIALLSLGPVACGDDVPGGPGTDASVGDVSIDPIQPRPDASGPQTDGSTPTDGSIPTDGATPPADGGEDGDAASTDGGGAENDGSTVEDDGGNGGDGSTDPDASTGDDDGGAGKDDAGTGDDDGGAGKDDAGSGEEDGGSDDDGGGTDPDGGNGGDPDGGNGGDPDGGNGGDPDGGNGGDPDGGNGGDPDGGNGGDPDGGSGGDPDGGSGGDPDGGNGGDPDGGSGGDPDGGNGGDPDGGSGGDPDAGDGDGGPEDGSLAAFCSGSGSVAEFGPGQTCSGDLAEQTFRFALCTCRDLRAQSNLRVDAFDSANGPYGGANILNDGTSGVNRELLMSGRLTQLGSVFVSGGGFSVGQQSNVTVNVFANGNAVQANSSSAIGRNGFINGDVFGRYNIGNDLHVPVGATVDPQTANNVSGSIVYGPIPSITPCPCGPNEIIDIAGFVAHGAQNNDNAEIGLDPDTWATGTGPGTIELPCGRYYLRGINHPQSLTIRALGRTVLYVDGDYIVGGSLRLEVADGAEIDLFVSGSLVAGAALRFGDETRPSAVRTYVAGTNPLLVQANSLFGGNFYAPNANVSFSAATDIYGALFAYDVVFGGNAGVHFDRAIRRAGDVCEPPGGNDGGVNDGGYDPDAGNGGGDDAGTGGGDDAGGDDAAVGPDAGPADAGGEPPQACDACYECDNGGACLSDGFCGPCVTDLDCCPTDICDQGVCTSPL